MSTERPSDYYGSTPSAENPGPYDPKDVATTQSIVEALYDCISGPAGKPREWQRMKSLFVSAAHSIRTGKLPNGEFACKIMTNDEYIRQMDGWLVDNGFFEKEVHRVEDRFGNIAHVFSTYESRRKADDPEPFMRGINSIQLLFDGKRW